VIGVGMMAGTLALFSWRLPAGLAGAQTLAFTTLVLFQLVLVFSYRSERFIITKLGVFRNVWLLCAVALSLLLQVLVVQWQPLQALFGTVSLSGIEWLASAAMAFALFLVAQLIIIFTPTPE
jgi:Ca2+-transporting ATPase